MIQLFQYPHQTLLEKSTAWTSKEIIEGSKYIEKFELDMLYLMERQHGMGLAANQIGITKRFFAIGHESFDTFAKPVIIWNPQVIMSSKEKVVDVEGCLSFNNIWLKVERPETIEVEYETTKGKKRYARLDGMESKCFQHELDHLEGITFNQRVSKIQWQMARK